MFSKLIRGLLGFFGLIEKTLVFKKSDFNEFARSLAPGSIICLHKRQHCDGLTDGIEAASNSAYSHVLNYLGQSSGFEGILHEIIEEIAEGFKCQSLDKYNSDDYQLIAFIFPITPREFMLLRASFAKWKDTPYDIQGIVHQAIPIIPDDPTKKYCSNVTTQCWMIENHIRDIVKKNVNPLDATPGDIFNGCYPNLECKITRFNC